MQKDSYNLDDPIVAIATALAPAALGIIRASGKDCIELVSKIFWPPDKLKEAKGNTIVYGWIVNPKTDKKIDEVLACVYREPKSFTGEDSIEIICHGGLAIILSIYRLFVENGFRPAEGGEFSFRAFANGKNDLTKSEAIKEIIDSKTDTASELAMGRLSGNLFNEIKRIKELLITTIAAIDVQIEYPEDEETTDGAFSKELILKVIEPLQILRDSWAAEKIFIQGAKVVLAGKTNAGKSSLFNALLKEDRAIVSDIHGTTRDWIEARLNFNGIPVSLYDTAGIRVTTDTIEAIGVERTKQISKDADLVLYLLDSIQILKEKKLDIEDLEFIENTKQDIIIIATKKDRLTIEEKKTLSSILNKELSKEWILISSKSAEGIKELSDYAYTKLTKNEKDSLAKKTVSSAMSMQSALGSERQRDLCTKAIQALNSAMQNAQEGFPLDMLTEDLEEALSYLGEITGEVNSDDILDKVFSGFCVGK